MQLSKLDARAARHSGGASPASSEPATPNQPPMKSTTFARPETERSSMALPDSPRPFIGGNPSADRDTVLADKLSDPAWEKLCIQTDGELTLKATCSCRKRNTSRPTSVARDIQKRHQPEWQQPQERGRAFKSPQSPKPRKEPNTDKQQAEQREQNTENNGEGGTGRGAGGKGEGPQTTRTRKRKKPGTEGATRGKHQEEEEGGKRRRGGEGARGPEKEDKKRQETRSRRERGKEKEQRKENKRRRKTGRRSKERGARLPGRAADQVSRQIVRAKDRAG